MSREPSRPLCKSSKIGGQWNETRCFDLSSAVEGLFTQFLKVFAPESKKLDSFDIIIIVVLNVVIGLAAGKVSDGEFPNRVSSGFCVGSFNGKYVLEQKGVARTCSCTRASATSCCCTRTWTTPSSASTYP